MQGFAAVAIGQFDWIGAKPIVAAAASPAMEGKGGDMRYCVGACCRLICLLMVPSLLFPFQQNPCVPTGPLYFGLFWPLLGPGWAQPTNLCGPCLDPHLVCSVRPCGARTVQAWRPTARHSTSVCTIRFSTAFFPPANRLTRDPGAAAMLYERTCAILNRMHGDKLVDSVGVAQRAAQRDHQPARSQRVLATAGAAGRR